MLVNPCVPVATKDVFAALGLRNGELLVGATDVIESPAWPEWRRIDRGLGRGARRSSPTISKRPRSASSPLIADVLSALRAADGVLLSRMSGSGATCFAIFAEDAEGARRLASRSGAIIPTGGCMRAC